MARPKVVEEKGDIQFFGEIDMSTTDPSQIGSTYPAWYFTEQLKRLEEDIEQEKRMLTMFNLPDASKPVKINKIKDMEARREKILEAQASLKPNMDKLHQISGELSEQLSNIMYRRSDEQKQLTDPHKVAEQMVSPCVEISGDAAKVARDNGLLVFKKDSKGMLTLNDATRLWQICQAAKGEDRNVERLRKD